MHSVQVSFQIPHTYSTFWAQFLFLWNFWTHWCFSNIFGQFTTFQTPKIMPLVTIKSLALLLSTIKSLLYFSIVIRIFFHNSFAVFSVQMSENMSSADILLGTKLATKLVFSFNSSDIVRRPQNLKKTSRLFFRKPQLYHSKKFYHYHWLLFQKIKHFYQIWDAFTYKWSSTCLNLSQSNDSAFIGDHKKRYH